MGAFSTGRVGDEAEARAAPAAPSVVVETAALSLAVEAALDRAGDYARASRAKATGRAYRADWAHFEDWCRAHGLDALPAAPEAVGAYLAAHAATLAPATLTRRVSAITVAHRVAGRHLDVRHPAVRDVLAGIRRERGTAQRRAAAATTDIVRRMVAACDSGTAIGLRDRALVLVGFGAALRRSEIVGLDRRDLTFIGEGVRITLRRSKGDQEGAGEVVGIVRVPGSPTCPVAALEAWLVAAGIDEGPVFRAVDRHGRIGAAVPNDRAVARVVQKLAAVLGLDASLYSGHSLRAGLATSAAMNGVEERRIAKQTRHRSAVVRRYIRDGEVFVRNVSGEVGL